MKILIFVLFVMLGLNIVASKEQVNDLKLKNVSDDDKYFCKADCAVFPKDPFCGYNNLKVMKTFINQCEMYVDNCNSKLGEI